MVHGGYMSAMPTEFFFLSIPSKDSVRARIFVFLCGICLDCSYCYTRTACLFPREPNIRQMVAKRQKMEQKTRGNHNI